MRSSLLVASPLAAALATLLASPAIAAEAADAAGPDPQRDPVDLEAVHVQAQRERKASSPKYTADLIDTPQTITVVDKATMDAQGLLSVRDVLGTLPGITFGAGEGGGGYG